MIYLFIFLPSRSRIYLSTYYMLDSLKTELTGLFKTDWVLVKLYL
jgi:hypothetical protein